MSQVISFHTFDPDVTACSIVSKFRSTSVHKEGNICLLECYRVPRAFNALFTATWRRYVYMFPLNVQQERQSVCAPVDAAESGDKRSSGTNFGWFPIIADSKSYYVDVDVTVVDTLLREYVDLGRKIM